MNKYNFVIFGSSWDLYKFSFSDVYDMQNVQYIPLPYSGIRKYVLAIFKRLRQYFPKVSIWTKIWINLFPIKKFFESKPLCFVYLWGYLIDINTTQLIDCLKKKYKDSKHILFNTDLYATRKSAYTAANAKQDFDLVLSFDPGDCEKYKFFYHPLVFSKYKSNNLSIKYDVVFIGQGKNRLKEIYSAYDILITNGLKVKFILIKIAEKDRRKEDSFEYVDTIPYLDNLKYIEQSKCVLEIMQKGGTGYTQRGCEVVGLNKKLLTNNCYIKNAPFYNEKYISVFDAIENIDLLFIDNLKRDEKVEYGDEQRENMSPKELLRFVEKKL